MFLFHRFCRAVQGRVAKELQCWTTFCDAVTVLLSIHLWVTLLLSRLLLAIYSFLSLLIIPFCFNIVSGLEIQVLTPDMFLSSPFIFFLHQNRCFCLRFLSFKGEFFVMIICNHCSVGLGLWGLQSKCNWFYHSVVLYYTYTPTENTHCCIRTIQKL